jgi:integrase
MGISRTGPRRRTRDDDDVTSTSSEDTDPTVEDACLEEKKFFGSLPLSPELILSGQEFLKEHCSFSGEAQYMIFMKYVQDMKTGREQRDKARRQVYLCRCPGGRYNDIVLLQFRDIVVKPFVHGGKEIWTTFRNGKNRGHAKDMLLSVERTMASMVELPAGLDVFLQEVETLKLTRPGDRPFEGLTTRGVGNILYRKKLGVTTYAFRKHFAARVYAETGGDKIKVSHRMGHANPKMTEAFYLSAAMIPVVEAYKAKNQIDGNKFCLPDAFYVC